MERVHMPCLKRHLMIARRLGDCCLSYSACLEPILISPVPLFTPCACTHEQERQLHAPACQLQDALVHKMAAACEAPIPDPAAGFRCMILPFRAHFGTPQWSTFSKDGRLG